MHIDDLISEFIGSLANMAVKNKSGLMQKDEILKILEFAKIENSDGDNYKKPQELKKKAIEYWTEKDRSTTVDNIKNTFTF